jgi:uncharacterized membrane protein
MAPTMLYRYGWFIQPGSSLMLQSLRFSSREVALISTFIAIGAVVRIGVDQVGDMVPGVAFAVVIKLGLSETLSFVAGFTYGPVVGFVTGFLIILLSDIASPFGAGPWTPFIASIIGLLGICAGIIRRVRPHPTLLMMTTSAVGLTLISESLQNIWVSVFYGVPIIATMVSGFPSLVTAMANNVILFPTVGSKAIKFVQEHHLNTAKKNNAYEK